MYVNVNIVHFRVATEKDYTIFHHSCIFVLRHIFLKVYFLQCNIFNDDKLLWSQVYSLSIWYEARHHAIVIIIVIVILLVIIIAVLVVVMEIVIVAIVISVIVV